MSHPHCPPGIGIDLLHLPRLTRVLFPQRKGPIDPNLDLRHLQRFASRILSPEELYTFNSRFLKGNAVNIQSPQWPEDVKKWLGVRWAAKEALYKAYPYPDLLSRKKSVNGTGLEEEVRGVSGKAARLTWKEVTMKYNAISGKPFLVIKRTLVSAESEEDSALLSITHDGGYICAMVLYTGNTQGIITDTEGQRILNIGMSALQGRSTKVKLQ